MKRIGVINNNNNNNNNNNILANSVVLSPLANYTDRVIAAGQRS
jgi:hypothetical protein